jgi:hypothetical protein
MANQQKTGRPNVQIRIPFLPNNAEIFCTASYMGMFQRIFLESNFYYEKCFFVTRCCRLDF